ncbi:MAG: hypothetical protein AAGD04_05865 [Pseudomonadota bacterium]
MVRFLVSLAALLALVSQAQAAQVDYLYEGTFYTFGFSVETEDLPNADFERVAFSISGENPSFPAYLSNWQAPEPWVAYSLFTLEFRDDGGVLDWSYESFEETNSSQAGLWGERERRYNPATMQTLQDDFAKAGLWQINTSATPSNGPSQAQGRAQLTSATAPVPLPAAFWIMSAGLGLLLGQKRLAFATAAATKPCPQSLRALPRA